MDASGASPERKKKRKSKPLKNVMLWIGDLKQLKLDDELGVETFNVMGVIVDMKAPADLEESRRPVGYHVDDGTGVIKVSHFMRNQVQQVNAELQQQPQQDQAQALNPLASRAARELEMAREAYPIGTCVEAKGRLQEFRGQSELLAYSVRRVEDPNDEVARMEMVARLKQEKVYPENLRPSPRSATD